MARFSLVFQTILSNSGKRLSIIHKCVPTKGFIASLNYPKHKNDKNKREECEACKKLIELIFGPPTTTVDPIHELQEEKRLLEMPAHLALPLVSEPEHKQSETAVETWSFEQDAIPSQYKYTIKVPEPLMFQYLEHNTSHCHPESKTLEHLTQEQAVLQPLNIEPTYEVLSVCGPKGEQELDEFEIESEAAASSAPSTGGSRLNKNLKCMIPAYKYISNLPEPFLYIDGPECFKELENTGNITNELCEPVITYEVQSVCAPPSDDVQKEADMQIIKGEVATGTFIVPGGSKKRFKCMIPAYEDATKIPEPFLYINGPECFPELINKEDFTDGLIEPGVINHEVQSVCAPCKDVIHLEKKMRTIKGVERLSVLCALREQKPKRKDYKCMIPAYEDATKIPEPFLYINGPEYFQEYEKGTLTGKQIESGGITDENTVFADETQQPEINMLKITGNVVGEPAISKHALKICEMHLKRSKCIHEIQSVCAPSKDEIKLELKLSKIKGVATRIPQEESKPKKHLKCMIPAYEHTLKIPEPFLYINGPDEEESLNMKLNSEKENDPRKITYEVQSVCVTPEKDISKIGLPLSVMWKRNKGQ